MEGELSRTEIEALAARCWHSPVEFGRIFVPDWFPTKMPWVHRGILALLTGQTDFLLDFGTEEWKDGTAEWTLRDLQKITGNFVTADRPGDPETTYSPIFTVRHDEDRIWIEVNVKQNVAIIMPRGFSKTTLVNLVNLRDICYKFLDFFLYTSEAAGHAERQLGTVKRELELNELIRMVFGDLVPPRQHTNKWTEEYIEPLNGVMVGAVGRGGQVRGFSKSARRPKRIIADDLEDEESVQSDTQRAKDRHWFFGTLGPAIQKGGKLFAIGTLLHTDSILARLEYATDWTWIRFGNRDRQGEPLWAWMMDDEEIEEKKRSMAAVGELSAYFLEYESRVVTDDTRMFPADKLIRIHRGYELFIGMALAMDPAISQESTADYCTFGVVGIEAGGAKHVVDFHGEIGMDPAAQIDKFFELHFRHLCKLPWDNRKHGIEAIGYQRSLIHLVRGEQFRRSQMLNTILGRPPGQDAYFEISPIFHGRVGKIARVQGILKPLYWTGRLTFDRPFSELDTQLLSWPSGKKDGPDVIAMAITLLDPFAALNLGDQEVLTKDTAPPLSVVLGGKSVLRAP